jgi:hypothetical protein
MNLFDDGFPLAPEREAGLPESYPQVLVAFGLAQVVNKDKSDAAGHEVFDDREFVKIVVPGDKNSLYFQPATDSHKRRFPKSYEAFTKREKGEATVGMPIVQWAPISRGVALTLYAAHIHTVEALAEVNDTYIDRLSIANARELREKARAWLKQAADSAAVHQAAVREKKLQDQIAAMQAQMNAMQEQMAEHQAKRGQGRPPKSEAA